MANVEHTLLRRAVSAQSGCTSSKIFCAPKRVKP
eukprot:CAMPEP_0198524302 /NCGR_PEP_ID=MMETSP1462-20131121/22669_1 /TAXON_ID=1333877 /ORGANISM="Brandtodinium nutriculum, Strain RCC3387" /LENGTH=33 /DNA_ID= /DNA_START= /DNA_END= /DNA_ORIENTATION=